VKDKKENAGLTNSQLAGRSRVWLEAIKACNHSQAHDRIAFADRVLGAFITRFGGR